MADRCERILGIDPGLNLTGYGLVTVGANGPCVAEAGVIRGGPAERGIAQRVLAIYQGIRDIMTQYSPQALALEELYSHYQRPRTAILMGHARGVICLAASQVNVPVVGYSATHVKRILTGSGRAPKPQVQEAVRRELGLDRIPDPPDVADALAIALCHYYLARRRMIA